MSAPLREDPVQQNAAQGTKGDSSEMKVVQGEFGKLKDNLSCVFWRMMSFNKCTGTYIKPFYSTSVRRAIYTPCLINTDTLRINK